MRRALFLGLMTAALCACHSSADSSAPAARMIPAATAIATSATPPPMAVALAPQINEADFLQFDKTLVLRRLRRPQARHARRGD